MRLIDVDALKQAINGTCSIKFFSLSNAMDIIDAMPTITAPVRHGKWESFEDVFMGTCYQCSECGLSFYLADGGTPKENEYHYCPNCGAKMDEGDDDEID